jgi:predicted transcriptional regulator
MDENKPPAERDRFTTTLDVDLLQKIKILAIYEKCSTNVLLEEAIEDLLKKYDDKNAKEETKRKADQGQLFKND